MPPEATAPPRYQAEPGWGRLPEGWTFVEVAGVAVDSRDRVFVFNRGAHPVVVFDREGNFLGSWGEGRFVRPHGLTIGPDDSLYCSDDSDHTVKKFTPDGKLIFTLGQSGKPSDTGATSVDFRTIVRSGPPFHYPTNVALAADGSLYIADGYGNARVHRFTAEGVHVQSWGDPGGGPGQFRVPHGIAVTGDGTVVVADRENCRLQFFDPEGNYLREWAGLARPCQVRVDAAGLYYVAELGFRAGMWPGTVAPTPDATGGRMSVFDASGNLLARWGGGLNPTAPGDFFAPHDVSFDSRGDLYVGEVCWSAGGNRGVVPADCHALQKFRKLT
ncbi:MAG: peptidyl-alpha-hydroxyglycine alpha-amidating lyase family protein [Isosphaeraceae bacterium]